VGGELHAQTTTAIRASARAENDPLPGWLLKDRLLTGRLLPPEWKRIQDSESYSGIRPRESVLTVLRENRLEWAIMAGLIASKGGFTGIITKP